MFHLMKRACLFMAFAGLHLFSNAQQAVTERVSVYFDTDKSALTADARRTLEKFLAHIDTLEGAQLTISGHTDARASREYNDLLSQRRVGSVMDFLVANKRSGLPEITSNLAEGENRPAAGNATAKDMALNRRVELTLTYPAKAPAAAKTDKIQDLYKRLAPKPSTYCIDNTRDTLLVCEKGTVVRIPAFCFSREKKQSCTTISVLEALSMSDMLLQNLSTESDGRLLETGGMVDIHAFDPKGSELQLIDRKALTLYFPTDSVANDFETFYGERDTSVFQTVNWHYPNQGRGGSPGNPGSLILNCPDMIINECERCRFFCRLRRTGVALAGAFDAEVRAGNKEFRACQRRLRRGTPVTRAVQVDCGIVNAYFAATGIQPPADSTALRNFYTEFMEKNGVATIQEAVALMQRQADSILKVHQVIQAKSYNTIRSLQMGMINCDRFSAADGPLVQVTSDVSQAANIDGKLIFTTIRSIMPAYMTTERTYYFPNIPEGSTNWMFFLKLEGEQAYLSLEKVTAGQSGPFEANFRKVSDAEIAQALKALDR